MHGKRMCNFFDAFLFLFYLGFLYFEGIFNGVIIPLNLVEYLSNRPQVSMGYRLINHAGCW